MNRKILFVTPSLTVGGMEKTLVTIANFLAKRNYSVTIILLYLPNDYIDELDKNICVKVVSDPRFSIKSRIPFIRRKYYDSELYKKAASPEELYRYYVGKENYDVEVAFFRGHSVKIISGSTNKKSTKIAWVHSDYRYCKGLMAYFRSDEELKKAYLKFNKIVCVSNQAKDAFIERIGNLSSISVCYNMININRINQLASESGYPIKHNNKPIIISVCRLVSVKGLIG